MPTLLPPNTVFTGTHPSEVGHLTRALIGCHVQAVHGTAVPGDLLQRMYAVAYAVIDANPSRTRVLATEAASYAYRYLTTFAPGAPWRLLDIQYNTGQGEVDLAWVDDSTGCVFFDEIKISRTHTGRSMPSKWIGQCRRYAAAGAQQYGDGFYGVRLLPLMVNDTARLVRAHGRLVRLAPTSEEPLAQAVLL